MPDENIYTVRYWIGPAELKTKNHPIYQFLRDLYSAYRDIMPMYELEAEADGYLWMYCSFPVPDVMKRLIYNYTGVVDLYLVQEL